MSLINILSSKTHNFSDKKGEMRYKYIKKYSNGKISLVSLSIDNKILYTIIPSIREEQLKKELKKALK